MIGIEKQSRGWGTPLNIHRYLAHRFALLLLFWGAFSSHHPPSHLEFSSVETEEGKNKLSLTCLKGRVSINTHLAANLATPTTMTTEERLLLETDPRLADKEGTQTKAAHDRRISTFRHSLPLHTRAHTRPHYTARRDLTASSLGGSRSFWQPTKRLRLKIDLSKISSRPHLNNSLSL